MRGGAGAEVRTCNSNNKVALENASLPHVMIEFTRTYSFNVMHLVVSAVSPLSGRSRQGQFPILHVLQ